MPTSTSPTSPTGPTGTTGTTGTTGPLVVAVLYDGLCTFEFGIVAEVFGLFRPEMGASWYRFASCAIEPGRLRAHGGLMIESENGPELLDQADIIVIPGWKGPQVDVPEDLCRRLRQAHERGARLAAICSGAFVLAATGLLDDVVAATHWRYADTLQERYPAVRVDARSLYNCHGRICTSAGSAAGIDLLLEIIRQDVGSRAANAVARRLVVPAHRSGGQAQYLERPVPPRPGGGIATLLDLIRESLDEPWTTVRMSAHCRMSLRTFLRRFHEATGMTPGEWLAEERVDAARTLLSESSLKIESLSAAVGFGSAHTLRYHFRRKVGITPMQYRLRFRAPGNADRP